MRSMVRWSVGLVAMLLVGCGSAERASEPARFPRKVSVVVVRPAEEISTEQVPGSVRPRNDATVESRVSGRVSKLLVAKGDSVSEGQLLIQIDAQEIQARLDQAVATLRQAEQDMKRFEKLRPTGAITQQEFDAVESRARVAQAGVVEAKTMVEYTQINAPFDGVITDKLIDVGDQALPGKALLRMEARTGYRFEADVPESLSPGLAMGKTLAVQVAGIESKLEGALSELSPTTDPNSRTLQVKVDLPSNVALRSGQFGYVLIPVERRPSIQIPLSALVQRGQLEIVFVAHEQSALLRLVRTGKRVGGTVEILAGLEDGEHLVVSGVEQLKDGDPIEMLP